MKVKIIIVMMATAWVLLSCSDRESEALRISRPLPKVDTGKNTFLIDTSQDTLLELQSGSSIFIPANSLVDADKKPFTGKAELNYEEYTDQAGIILSGIPMLYDSAGDMQYFKSAGMFSIDAQSTDGKPLAIADGKTVTVSLASAVDDGDKPYNFYQYDTVAGSWRYLATRSAEPAAPKPIDSVSTEATASVNTSKTRVIEDFVFDLAVNYSNFPELKQMREVMWKYSGNKSYRDPEKEQWIFSKKWPTTTLNPDPSVKGAYILVLKSKTDSFTTSVIPVDVASGDASTNVDIDKTNDEIGRVTARVLNEQTLFRSMQLSGFGIYNWDICFMLANSHDIKIRFHTENGPVTNVIRIYQVFTNINSAIEPMLTDEEYRKVKVSEDPFVFLAIDNDGKTMICNNTEDLINTDEGETTDLTFTATGKTIESAEDFKSLIGSL